MARKKTTLNLTPELPEVRSTDFNLFYVPPEKPRDLSIDIFTRSIDNFVNNAGTAMALNAEKKEKEVNDAEALKQFNENRSGFNEAVKKGEIPKEANPYFIEKYKELTLNKKANEFKADIYRKYSEMKVLDNPDPNAFDKFYKDQLKDFITNNNLGTFDALQLEKGFFSETSKTRNSLFNTHVNSQMSKIGEDYKKGFKESIQGKFDKNFSNEQMGADISAFIKDAVKNGLSKSTAQDYLLESLKEWATTTEDLEFAERLLRDLPNHVKLGTDSLANVKGLKNDFDEIKEKIDDRQLQKEKDEATKLTTANTIETFEASNYADNYETYSDATESDEWETFSRNKKDKIFKEFESREQGFDSQTDLYVDETINNLLKESKYDEALELLSNSVTSVEKSYYYKKKAEIQDFKFTEKDGLLANDYYRFFKKKVEGFADLANKGKKFGTDEISSVEHEKFEATIRKWLKDYPSDKFESPTEREEKFNEFVKKSYQLVLDKALADDGNSLTDGNVTISGETDATPIIVNPEDLQ